MQLVAPARKEEKLGAYSHVNYFVSVAFARRSNCPRWKAGTAMSFLGAESHGTRIVG